MADNWMINVNGQIYGPYTLTEMRSFAVEGRLAAYSLVAHKGETAYFAAGQSQELAPLFTPKVPPKSAAGDHARSDVDPGFGPGPGAERTRYVIVAEMKTRSVSYIDKTLKQIGPYCQVTPNSWLLTTEKPLNVLRDTLMQQLGKIDTLCIVDATHNKAVWCNFDPQGESRIRQVWLSQT